MAVASSWSTSRGALGPAPAPPRLARAAHSQFLQMVLAQTWVFLKMQAVIQSEICNYVAKREDVAYPEKLVCEHFPPRPIFLTVRAAANKPATGFEMWERGSISQLFELSSLNRRETWYLTLSMTVWVLSHFTTLSRYTLRRALPIHLPAHAHSIPHSPRSSKTSRRRRSTLRGGFSCPPQMVKAQNVCSTAQWRGCSAACATSSVLSVL